MSKMYSLSLALIVFGGMVAASNQNETTYTLTGRIVDSDTGIPIPARVYIQRTDGKWFFAKSSGGTAVEYRKQRPNVPPSVEMHTTLSAHPFTASLPAGTYNVVIERGHEYLTLRKKIVIAGKPANETFRLRRWIDMAGKGWYSGDTHVHRSLDELPNVMLAEDLNVAFPLVYWVTKAYAPPKSGDRSIKRDPPAKPVHVDETHIYYPRNTEYEIFTVGAKRHTLGAFFVLNHKSIFTKGVPPVQEIGEQAHKEGALLDLDKPNWPWSMMLIPILNIDLFELSNNHVWRTDFAFANFGDPAPEYMNVQKNAKGFTENGWIDFNFQNYYALLNCGFRLRPTAGTASGVHPVPLGFGRVYVHCGEKLRYREWVDGLDKGRSFVTTGPMLFAQVEGQKPGAIFKQNSTKAKDYKVKCDVVSQSPLEKIEVVLNGKVIRQSKPKNQTVGLRTGTYSNLMETTVKINETSWVVMRCFEKRGDRLRFAHSAPFHFEVAGKSIRPRRAEVKFLVDRLTAQLKRNTGVLKDDALAEYRRGLEIYQRILKNAKD